MIKNSDYNHYYFYYLKLLLFTLACFPRYLFSFKCPTSVINDLTHGLAHLAHD